MIKLFFLKKIVSISFVIATLIFVAPTMGRAQSSGDDNEGLKSFYEEGPLKDLTTVLALGAGGAVLGLSTLSFSKDPGEHLNRVLVGAAIGVIVGVGYVAFAQATQSVDSISSSSSSSSYQLQNLPPSSYSYSLRDKKTGSKNDWQLNYTFEF